MTFSRQSSLRVGTFLVAGIVLAGILTTGQFRVTAGGGRPIVKTHFSVDHVRVSTNRPFDAVAQALVRQLGRFDPAALKSLADGGDVEAARTALEAMAGPSGFALFSTSDHGALLRLAGQKRKAVQYVVGNPLFALRMTQHDIRAGLYAPLRVLLYESDDATTCLDYDLPSSLFGQFGNGRIDPTAVMLDQKLAALVAAAIE